MTTQLKGNCLACLVRKNVVHTDFQGLTFLHQYSAWPGTVILWSAERKQAVTRVTTKMIRFGLKITKQFWKDPEKKRPFPRLYPISESWKRFLMLYIFIPGFDHIFSVKIVLSILTFLIYQDNDTDISNSLPIWVIGHALSVAVINWQAFEFQPILQLRSSPRALYRQLSLCWLSCSVGHTPCWRDQTRSKQQPRVCNFGFQFVPYHVLDTFTFPFLRT